MIELKQIYTLDGKKFLLLIIGNDAFVQPLDCGPCALLARDVIGVVWIDSHCVLTKEHRLINLSNNELVLEGYFQNVKAEMGGGVAAVKTNGKSIVYRMLSSENWRSHTFKTNVVQFSLGNMFALFLLQNGEVWAAGLNGRKWWNGSVVSGDLVLFDLFFLSRHTLDISTWHDSYAILTENNIHYGKYDVHGSGHSFFQIGYGARYTYHGVGKFHKQVSSPTDIKRWEVPILDYRNKEPYSMTKLVLAGRKILVWFKDGDIWLLSTFTLDLEGQFKGISNEQIVECLYSLDSIVFLTQSGNILVSDHEWDRPTAVYSLLAHLYEPYWYPDRNTFESGIFEERYTERANIVFVGSLLNTFHKYFPVLVDDILCDVFSFARQSPSQRQLLDPPKSLSATERLTSCVKAFYSFDPLNMNKPPNIFAALMCGIKAFFGFDVSSTHHAPPPEYKSMSPDGLCFYWAIIDQFHIHNIDTSHLPANLQTIIATSDAQALHDAVAAHLPHFISTLSPEVLPVLAPEIEAHINHPHDWAHGPTIDATNDLLNGVAHINVNIFNQAGQQTGHYDSTAGGHALTLGLQGNHYFSYHLDHHPEPAGPTVGFGDLLGGFSSVL